ncbi:hypothetical protein ACFSC3_11455 [Sphingomonas floccifaciens]|uniref:Uncharacterized protein n=1 Tax=Sphingomonas floccifaciens TaxID=1844115 RepID=A0ABW4NDG3_9SPHN
MPGALAILLQAGSTLVLDASVGQRPCQSTPDEVIVCARSDRPTTRLSMTIAGHIGTVLVEPSGPRYLMCNPDFIARSGITGDSPVLIASVGSVDVVGGRATLPVTILGQSSELGVRWSSYRTVEGADCIVGPRSLGYRSVIFQLGRDRPDALDTVFPFDRYDRTNMVYATLPVGGAKIAMRIELAYPESVVTAPAARVIAPVLGGSMVGPPRSEMIINGVARPVRTLALRMPLAIGPVRLASLSARIVDYGQAQNLKTLTSDDGEADAVVVKAKTDPPAAQRLLRVGRDALANCVSITVDLRARKLTLRC